MPLLRDFMDRLRDCSDWLRIQKRTEELQAVDTILRFRLEAAAAAYRINMDLDNIEELFSLASASPRGELSGDISLAIAATIEYCRQVAPEPDPDAQELYLRKPLEALHPSWKSLPSGGAETHRAYGVPSYHLQAAIIGGLTCPREGARNTVITFNYDTVLESALADLQIPFSYGLDSAALDETAKCARNAPLQILKVHGSVNWARTSTDSVTVFGDYSAVRAAKAPVHLVPPTWNKVLTGALTEVWRKAATAISEATRVIIVGFSMPPTDVHFKYLLAAGLEQNISLRKVLFVDPGPDALRDRVGEIFRKTEGLVDYEAATAAAFFRGGSGVAKINRKPFGDYR